MPVLLAGSFLLQTASNINGGRSGCSIDSVSLAVLPIKRSY